MTGRKLSLDNLQIDAVERGSNGAIIIEWSSKDIGFGEFVLKFGDDNKLHAQTESMDADQDKEFTRKILHLLTDLVVIDN